MDFKLTLEHDILTNLSAICWRDKLISFYYKNSLDVTKTYLCNKAKGLNVGSPMSRRSHISHSKKKKKSLFVGKRPILLYPESKLFQILVAFSKGKENL